MGKYVNVKVVEVRLSEPDTPAVFFDGNPEIVVRAFREGREEGHKIKSKDIGVGRGVVVNFAEVLVVLDDFTADIVREGGMRKVDDDEMYPHGRFVVVLRRRVVFHDQDVGEAEIVVDDAAGVDVVESSEDGVEVGFGQRRRRFSTGRGQTVVPWRDVAGRRRGGDTGPLPRPQAPGAAT